MNPIQTIHVRAGVRIIPGTLKSYLGPVTRRVFSWSLRMRTRFELLTVSERLLRDAGLDEDESLRLARYRNRNVGLATAGPSHWIHRSGEKEMAMAEETTIGRTDKSA